ncbi:MAG: NUDIX hydrolase [Gemmatimonadetes bacterium]|nr:NUDIX hydrolase [Gemmatimonadota bacterium]
MDRPRAARLGSRGIYSGRVIALHIDSVRYPDGSTGELEIVRHGGAAGVVAVADALQEADPRLLLVRQYRYAAGGYLYEIPAGRLDEGEPPEACARRELREETGYTAGSLRPLTTICTTPGFTDERIHLFLAEDLKRGEAASERDEFLEVQLLRLSQVLKMVRQGGVVDGKTIVGLLYFAQFLRDK